MKPTLSVWRAGASHVERQEVSAVDADVHVTDAVHGVVPRTFLYIGTVERARLTVSGDESVMAQHVNDVARIRHISTESTRNKKQDKHRGHCWRPLQRIK